MCNRTHNAKTKHGEAAQRTGGGPVREALALVTRPRGRTTGTDSLLGIFWQPHEPPIYFRQSPLWNTNLVKRNALFIIRDNRSWF